MKIKVLLALVLVNMISAGEPESAFDADLQLEQEAQELEKEQKEEQEAAARAARIAADQNNQQKTPTSGTKPVPTVPATQDVIPMTPGIVQAGSSITTQPVLDLPSVTAPIERTAFKTLETNVTKLEARIKTAGDRAAVKNALSAYRNTYGSQAQYLSPAARAAFEPSAVIYNLIAARQAEYAATPSVVDILTDATADHSLWDKIMSSPTTLQNKARQQVRTGMDAFVSKMNQANVLHALLEVQGNLLDSKIQQTTVTQNSATYKLYVQQWQDQYAGLQQVFAPDSAIPRMFRSLVTRLQDLNFIDMQADIGKQVDKCQKFKQAYRQYLTYYSAFVLKPGEKLADEQVGAFDFVDDMYEQLQKQIALEFARRNAQGFWETFLRKIKEFVGLQASISQQLKSLDATYLQDIQDKMYNMSLLQGALTPEHISNLATVKNDMDAIRALANLRLEKISIDTFRSSLAYDVTTKTIDQNLSDMFCPTVDTSPTVMDQYTFKRPNSGIPLLKTEYVQRFIQYRLLGMSETPDAVAFDDEFANLVTDNLWNINYQYGTKESIQVFIKSIIRFDPINKELVLDFDPEKLGPVGTLSNQDISMLNGWRDLSQAIREWSKKDIAKLSTIMEKPKEQYPEKEDAQIAGSYLLLRAVMLKDNKVNTDQDIDTIRNLALMCNSRFGQGIVAQALRGAAPVDLQPFKQNAQGMMPFFYGNPNNQQKDGGIAGIYAVIEANYTANILASLQQQQNQSPKSSGYKFIPYVVPLPQNPTPLPTNPPAEGGGGGHGHGGHGGDEPDEKKCYDDKHNEVKCKDDEDSSTSKPAK